jgi:hypothetical protein
MIIAHLEAVHAAGIAGCLSVVAASFLMLGVHRPGRR